MTIFDFYDLINASQEEIDSATNYVEAIDPGIPDPLKIALYLLAIRIRKLEKIGEL